VYVYAEPEFEVAVEPALEGSVVLLVVYFVP
jgi:hypothetical protein